MAKSKSSKRKRNALVLPDFPQKLSRLSDTRTVSAASDSSVNVTSLQTLMSENELETTINTLTLLSEFPSILKSKACKDLRVAVWDFRQACTTGVNAANASESSLTGRITAAITDGKYIEARIGLAEMRIRNDVPKLGALCRWVRDLDVVSGLSSRQEGTGQLVKERSLRDEQLLVVLDSIMRLAGPVDVSFQDNISLTSPIALQKLWDAGNGGASAEIYAAVLNHHIQDWLPANFENYFSVIETTPGPLRKPPNHHPAMLYASKHDLLLGSDSKTILQHHPVVPNLSLISGALSVEECMRIIAAAESVGFLPDAPVSEDNNETSSVLAHNFYWLVDEQFCAKLWNRVRPHIPDQVRGKKARGLNRRFRIYRYVPNAEYRCHIDGAWPPSGINPISNAYVYDSSPPGARQSSLFTFLIYLNDEFKGGETTFFLPSAREGILNAYPVKPVIGAVAMFPHGETAGALLHEGTGVINGAKYVIRTDVLYDVDATT